MTTSVMIAYELATLLPSALLLCYAGQRVIKLWRNREKASTLEWIRDCVWFGIVFFVVSLWPNYSYPYDSPGSSFLFLAAIAAFVSSVIQESSGNSRWLHLFSKIARIFLVIACFSFLFLALQYLLVLRSIFMSEDFFHYVCVARHMASGIGDLDPICYFYFPGVFRFWRMILYLTDGSLDSLQWAYLIVIAADALLIGLVVYRVVRNFCLSTLSAAWFVLFYSRFGGFDGITEPMATFPLLIGLLVWGGKSFLGREGLIRTFAFSIGIGISLYTRQQAGFVSLGAISFFITYLIQEKSEEIIDLKRLLLMPLIAAAVVIVGILFEGHGLQPLFTGLGHLPNYDFDLPSRFTDALWKFAARLPFLTILSTTALLIWLVCLIKFRSMILQPWCQMLGYSVVAGFFSLIPFFGRPHLHYALFSGAMFIIASTVTIDVLTRIVPQPIRKSAPFYFFLIVLSLWQFVDDRTRPTFYAWPPEKPIIRPKQKIVFMAPDVIADLKSMKKYIQPLEKTYVLPPSQNEFHFFLETTYPFYGWFRPLSIIKAINSPGLKNVIVVKSKAIYPEDLRVARVSFQYDSADQILKQQGFQPVVELPSMVLWRKPTR